MSERKPGDFAAAFTSVYLGTGPAARLTVGRGKSRPDQSPEDKGAFIPACPNCSRPRLQKKGLLTEIRSFPKEAGTDGEDYETAEYITLRLSKNVENRTFSGRGGEGGGRS